MLCTPKQNAFWITFLSYAAIHALRMCYSFNKVNLQRQFQLTEFYLGLLDAVLYISYALGVFIRYQIFQANSNMKQLYLITSILASSSFASLAYLSLFSSLNILTLQIAKILLALAVFAFGFSHLAFYQICGAVISGYYDSKTQSAKLGFWGSSASVGNIIGFLISNLIIHQFSLKWQVTFFLMAIVSLLMGFVFYYLLQIPVQDQSYKMELYALQTQSQRKSFPNPSQQQQYKSNKEIRIQHWLSFIGKVISTSSQARYTYAAYITMKVTVYTFLMWFPIFLVSKNLEQVSGYISTLFDVGGTLGGYLIGKLHGINFDIDNGNDKTHSEFYRMLLKYRNSLLILIVIGVILVFIIIDGSIMAYCPLTLLIGFFLGGSYNNISSHQIFKIAENHMLYTDMLLNLSVGISCLMVGLIQIITAFLFKWDDSNNAPGEKANYGIFFIVLFVLMVICAGIMWKRARPFRKDDSQ